uniref:Uncharacterized protein n=1 Tax=Klebsiella pneumoniae TaxID=573 RepID=A0A8B0STT3_KLEPN|nr:hypothetical protein [Klebsiella pneumoniae]
MRLQSKKVTLQGKKLKPLLLTNSKNLFQIGVFLLPALKELSKRPTI